MKRSVVWLLALGLVWGAGCVSSRRGGATNGKSLVRPVVAVKDLKDLSGYRGRWKLSSGITEALGTRLLESEQVILLNDYSDTGLVGDVVRLGREWLRKDPAGSPTRSVRAEFVIEGSIVEFSAGPDSRSQDRRRGSGARVALQLRLRDVRSGEILAAVRAAGEGPEGSAPTRGSEPGFGSDAFYRMPLGRATDAALASAARELLTALPALTWDPRVAEVEGDLVLLNGGENANVKAGQEFLVRDAPRAVTDPVRGVEIDRLPGAVRGRVRVMDVRPTSARAELLEGRAARGDALEPATGETAGRRARR